MIHVQRNFGRTRDDSRSQAEGADCASPESNDDGDNGDEDEEEDDEEEEVEEKEKQDDYAGSGSAASTLITLFTDSQQKISLRTGYNEKEKVRVQQIYLHTCYEVSTWSVQFSVLIGCQL